MTDHSTTGAPRTEAGRALAHFVYGVALVANYETAAKVGDDVERAIARIEREAADIDVIRLADLIHETTCMEMGFGDGYYDSDHVGASACRERAATIYARLRASDTATGRET